MPVQYLIALPQPAAARGSEPSLSFSANGPEAFAEQLQTALRTTTLFERWRSLQDEPDEVDPAFGATDPAATVSGEQQGLRINLSVTTSLPGDVFKQRLRLLAGHHWELRDVR